MFIKVKVFPKSKKSGIVQKSNDSFEVRVKAKAQKGEANKAVLQALADFFNINPSQIRLVKGGKQKSKIFKLPDEPNQAP